MYSTTFGICILQYMGLILLMFFCTRTSIASSLKKDQYNVRSTNWYCDVFNGRKGIRHELYHAIHPYAKAYNKYIKDCDKNKESSYLNYWNVNTLYGCTISQKLPKGAFE